MRSEVFLRENLIALLTAIATAHADLARRLDDPDTAVYSAGFRAALRAVAAALNIDFQPDSVEPSTKNLTTPEARFTSPLDSVVIRLQPQPRFPESLMLQQQELPTDF